MADDIEIKQIKIACSNIEMPKFEKSFSKRHVSFGKDDKFPDYLIHLLDNSPKHNAIVNGKVDYIYGNGIKSKENNEFSLEFISKISNTIYRAIFDRCAFGMGYIECIPNNAKKGWIFNHIGYARMRSNEDNTEFYYKKNWQKYTGEKEVVYKSFNPRIFVKSILLFKDYRPSVELSTYTVPSFFSARNYIEADISVAQHTLSNAEVGFSASKMLNFFNGDPEPARKKEIDDSVNKKFSGSNGKKIIVSFNNIDSQKPTIEDLGTSDLTKEDFRAVDELISSNIYAGHRITNSALFGIPSLNHSLGGNAGAELKISYDIFKQTFVNAEQQKIEKIINLMAMANGIEDTFYLQPTNPVGYTFTENTIKEVAPKAWLLEQMGIDVNLFNKSSSRVLENLDSLSPLVSNKVIEKMTDNEIRSLVELPNKENGDQLTDANGVVVAASPTSVPTTTTVEENYVNEHLKNLTGRQMQTMNRVVREFSKGKLSQEAAVMMLKNSLGVNEDEAKLLLGIKEESEIDFSSDENVADIFEPHGENRDLFFSLDKRQMNFKDENELIEIEDKIRDYIKENPNKTTVEIAEELSVKENVVKKFIDKIGGSGIEKIKIPKFEIRYSYELRSGVTGPEILPNGRTRPFCKRLLKANKLYTRQDIQKISAMLGYDVMVRSGGFWNNGGTVSAQCRHEFFSQIVVRK